MTIGIAAKSYLLVCALPVEVCGQLEGVLYTGIGKINAALALQNALLALQTAKRLPQYVINYGTAGSQIYATGRLVQCTSFLQRDMDATELGFELFATPFENDPPLIIDPQWDAFLLDNTATCGTGDSFVSASKRYQGDVLDMEAYALAKVCHLWQIPFTAIKFITDGAGDSAQRDWEMNLSQGMALFKAQVLPLLDRLDS